MRRLYDVSFLPKNGTFHRYIVSLTEEERYEVYSGLSRLWEEGKVVMFEVGEENHIEEGQKLLKRIRNWWS